MSRLENKATQPPLVGQPHAVAEKLPVIPNPPVTQVHSGEGDSLEGRPPITSLLLKEQKVHRMFTP
jgi:hypothetical protein